MKTFFRLLCFVAAAFSAGKAFATPTIAITAPTTGSTINLNATPAPVTISANTTIGTSTGTLVSSVQFFANGVSIGVVGGGTGSFGVYSISWNPSATGTYTLTATVTDTGTTNNSATSPLVIVTITGGATVALTNPTAGSVLGAGSTVSIAATATPVGGTTINRVEFLAGTSVVGTSFSAPYSIQWIPSAGGSVSLTARAIDSAGFTSTSSAIGVNVTVPSVSITSPASGAGVTVGVPAVISANAASVSPATIAKVEFLAGSTLIGTVTNSPYSVSWTPTTTGNVALTARVTDSNGAVVTSAAVNVSASSAIATVAITSPLNGANVISNTATTVTATATPASGVVSKVEFFLGSSSTPFGTAFSAPYSVAWTPTSAGLFALTAKVTDSSGNSATSAVVNVNVTAASRVVVLNVPTNNAVIAEGSTAFLRATPTFSDAIVSKVEYYLDGVAVAQSTTSPYAVDYLFPTAGVHTFFARAVASDSATTDSPTITITVAPAVGNPPTVGIGAPVNGAYVATGTTVALSGFALDSDGTITGVQLFANGVAIGTATLGANGTWTFNWPASGSGGVQLSALATDDKGNNTVSPPVGVNVTDTSSPAITLSLAPGIVGPSGATMPASSTRNLLATVTAAPGRAVARVEFFLNGTKIGEKTSAPFNLRFTAPGTPGAYVLSARATDNTGLARDFQLPLTVTAAVGQPPAINIVTPPFGSTILFPTNGVAVNAAATASGGTITSVQFFVNGGTDLLSAVGLDTTAPYAVTFTPTAPGTYILDAIALDDRGNTGVSNSVVVNAAFAAPTTTITSPNGSTATRATPNVPLNISATAQGGNGAAVLLVEFLIDGVPVGTKNAPTSGTNYTFAWTPTFAQLGLHTLTTRVTDANLQSATSAGVSINVANIVGTPPTVAITAPTGTQPIVLQSLSVVNFVANAFASGAGNSLRPVEFYLNDVSIGVGAREQATNLWRLAYNFFDYDFASATADVNGRYPLTLYAIARDTNGNQTISASVNLSIALSTSSPPTVTLVGQGAPAVNQGTQFLMTATPTDFDGTVTSLQLFVNGAVSGTPILNPAAQVSVPYLPTAAGSFNLYVVATDDTGNTAVSSPSIVLNVTAVTAPLTQVIRPTDDTTVTTAGAPVFLEATATSPNSATLTVTFVATLNGGARTVVNATQVVNTNTYRAVWTPTVAGTYTITSTATVPGTTATSNSGNSRRVTVASIVGLSPVVTVNAPTNNSTVTTASTVNFTATATDSDGSVVGVEFFVGRNSIGQATRDQLTNTWRLTASFAGYPIGTTDVVALARDNAGNVNDATATTNINVVAAASIAPSVTIAASNLNPAFSRQVQLTANARDTDGAVIAVQYFANGTNLGTSGNAGTNYLVNWTPNQSGTFNVWGVATDNSGNTTVAATVQVTVRRNNPVLEDAAFILQTYSDIANTTTINPLVFADLDAQLGAGTLTRAQFTTTLTADPAFVPPMNLLLAYYIVMGQWPTATNYNTLLPTARTSLPNAIGAILSSNEYFAKFGVVPTVALLNSGTSAIPARTFLTRLHANAGLPPPSDTDLLRFMNNDTTFGGTLGRGYNVVGLNTAIADFVTNVNSSNAVLIKRGQAAALYYQLDRPTVSVTTDQIAARVLVLAALPDMTAMADAALKDILYAYRFVTILQHPQSLVVAPRSGAIFTVDALGQPPLTYQWLLNGAPVAGATDAKFFLSNIDASKVGNYTVVVTSAQSSATSDVASLTLSTTPTRLANVSTRGLTAGGANVLIGGFVVTGASNQTRQMLIRVVGPTLGGAPYNVPNTLADPRLEVYASGASLPILTNDNWGAQVGGTAAVTALQQAATRVNAFALPTGSADAAVLANLPPGSYTVLARGPNTNSTGIVLFEVYDVTQGVPTGPKAINVSTRGNVGVGDNILIAGFVVQGAVARRVLIRGVGPTLADQRFGLPAGSTLADPQITLVEQATGKIVKVNDDWTTDPVEAAVIAAAGTSGGAFPLLTGSKDAAMMVMLAPGGYTVKLNGAGTTTGIAIVEVYDVDP
jgi:hypothetical protein